MRATVSRAARLTAFACAALVAAHAAPASAGGSSISPTRITLSKGSPSSIIVITNTGPTAQRYSVSARAWEQMPENQITLSDTNDVVFFPGSFTLEPMRQQRIRVGVTAAAAESERTYRVIVSELPPLQSVLERNHPVGLDFTTAFSVPIYVAPPVPRYGADVANVVVRPDELRFTVKNTGNVHMVAKSMKVIASGDGGPIASTESSAWFVLQNNQRGFTVPIPKGACGAVKSVSISIDTGDASVRRAIVPEHACS